MNDKTPPPEADGDAAMASPIRVMVVEDHPAIRSGLRMMLGTDDRVRVVAEAANAEEAMAVAAAEDQPLDVVLMDVRLPGKDGVELTRDLLALYTGGNGKLAPRVIGLSMHDEPEFRRRMIEAGASAYVIKSGAAREMLDAIRQVTAGR